jgi:hypothetical protein
MSFNKFIYHFNTLFEVIIFRSFSKCLETYCTIHQSINQRYFRYFAWSFCISILSNLNFLHYSGHIIAAAVIILHLIGKYRFQYQNCILLIEFPYSLFTITHSPFIIWIVSIAFKTFSKDLDFNHRFFCWVMYLINLEIFFSFNYQCLSFTSLISM